MGAGKSAERIQESGTGTGRAWPPVLALIHEIEQYMFYKIHSMKLSPCFVLFLLVGLFIFLFFDCLGFLDFVCLFLF